MRAIVTGRQMKQIDDYAIYQTGIPSAALMERAAAAIAEEAEEEACLNDRIMAVCGTGNNGADGIAAARMLHIKGYNVMVMLVGDRKRETAECRLQRSIAEKLNISVTAFSDFIPGKCDILIDAIFGVGLVREITGEYKEVIEMLSDIKIRKKIAVDIPSGINADNGRIMGTALAADITVTFGFEKAGTAVYPGKGFSGKVKICDIGFPFEKKSITGNVMYAFTKEDMALMPVRKPWSNKGTYGKVLVAAGSENMCGAAYLCALSAYRMGAGLVRILTVKSNREILQGLLPEAILTVYEPESIERSKIEEVCRWASVIAAGPGLSTQDYAKEILEIILTNAYVPIILDADALNIIAAYPYLKKYYTENIIITPHPGEMSRLTGKTIGEIKENTINLARDYADENNITCVLKDAVTVTAVGNGKIYINTSGTPAMAKAGSGDVLSGIIAGLSAAGMEEAAAFGVWLHGIAGEKAARQHGEHGILARELADNLQFEEGQYYEEL